MSKQHQYLIAAVSASIVLALLLAGWQRPQRVVNRATAALSESNSQRFKATLLLHNKQSTATTLGEQGTVQIELTGGYVNTKQPTLASDIIVTIKNESVTVQLMGEMRFIDDKAYLLISKAPAIFPALTPLKGKWVEVPRGGSADSLAESPTTPLFQAVTYQGIETVEGKKTRRYQAQASQETLVRLMDNVAQLLGTQLTSQQIADLKETADQLHSLPVDVWISALSGELRQVHLAATVPNGNTLDFNVVLSDQNKEFAPTKPEGAKPIKDIVEEAKKQK